jgi:Na+-driven multidrug efflux pump
VMLGLTVGTVAFVARAHGAGGTERINHVLHQGQTRRLPSSV